MKKWIKKYHVNLIICFLLVSGPVSAYEAMEVASVTQSDMDPKERIRANLEAFIIKWTEVHKRNPARKLAPEISAWIVKAAFLAAVSPWELLFICMRETSLNPRTGFAVGEIGPGQLHGNALKYVIKKLKTTKEALSKQSFIAYHGVAVWLKYCKTKCDKYPYGEYHTGRCKDCFYDRDVKRAMMWVRKNERNLVRAISTH